MNDARDPGNQAFAAALYKRLAAVPGNLFFSPASARLALAMACEGARGETARELLDVLRLPPEEEARAEAARSIFAAATKNTDKFVLRVVSRLWGSASIAFLPAFVAALGDHYKAPLERVNFANDPEAARATINHSIEAATEHKIKDLLPPRSIAAATKLILTSAVYFKAAWAFEFMDWITQPRDFSTAPGTTIQVPTMERQALFGYGEHDGVRLVELPYQDGDLSMVIALPAERFGLADLEARQNGGWLDLAFASITPETVRLRLPRFRVESSFSLVDSLSALGIQCAFQYGDADFSGMDGSREIFIGDVVHKTFIAVDEQGTEAAAATAVLMPAGGPPPKPVTVRDVFVDEPFFLAIRDTVRGGVVFLGRVENPAALPR